MAGMVGGATGAALAAIVMIFEMTLDYNVVIPMTITVAVSYGVRRVLCRESIYTMKLVRRGHFVPDALHSNYDLVKRARDIMDAPLVVSLKNQTATELVQLFAGHPQSLCALAEDAGQVSGFITRNDVLSHPDGTVTLTELVRQDYVVVTPDTATFEVVARLRNSNAFVVKGVITRRHLGDVLVETAELYLD